MIDRNQARNLWDSAADWWAQHLREDPNRKEQLFPLLLELLGDVKEKRVLDAGCGEGTMSRLLSTKGAQVTGIDFSRIIDFAKAEEESQRLGISYSKIDIAEASESFTPGYFDSALCSLVIHSCPALQSPLRSLRQVLRTEGSLVVADLHPDFVTPYSLWLKEWRAVDDSRNGSYLVKVALDAPPVPYFYRTRQSLKRAFAEAGFEILAVTEPRPPVVNRPAPGESLFIFFQLVAR